MFAKQCVLFTFFATGLFGASFAPFCDQRSAQLFVQGDFLYWSAWLNPLEYAWVMTPTESNDPLQLRPNQERKSLQNRWGPGFRIEAGCLFECGWNIDLQWTDFHTRLIGSTHEDSPVLAAILLQFVEDIPLKDGGLRARQAHASWKLEYDTLDLTLTLDCSVSPHFSLHPYLGAKAARIRQRANVRYDSLIFFQEEPFPPHEFIEYSIDRESGLIQANAWGIGPLVGYSAVWHNSSTLQVFGAMSGAISWMSTRNDFLMTVQNNTLKPERSSYTQRLVTDADSGIWPYVQAAIGIDWHRCFARASRLDIQVKYEVLHWWDTVNKELSLQGLTIAGGIQF